MNTSSNMTTTTPIAASILPPVGDVASIENKHLLWAILTEEQVFNGIREDKAPAIINIFETAINTVKNTRTNMDDGMAPMSSDSNLAALNKEVIRRVIAEISRYKTSLGLGSGSSVANSASGAAAAAAADSNETNYKAADMHESRIRDITSKLKLHEDDMNSFLVLKKPAEINFADARANDDRPIGEEMDQLIQAALASRARELEIMQFQPQSPHTSATPTSAPTTPATPNSTPTHNINSSNSNDKKTVSFTNNAIIGDHIGEGVNGSDTDTNFNINAIVNKLKRAATTTTTTTTPTDANNDNELLQSLMRSIIEIQQELRDIKNLLLGAASRA